MKRIVGIAAGNIATSLAEHKPEKVYVLISKGFTIEEGLAVVNKIKEQYSNKEFTIVAINDITEIPKGEVCFNLPKTKPEIIYPQEFKEIVCHSGDLLSGKEKRRERRKQERKK